MTFPLWAYPLLFLTGFAAGVIDSVAGGGGILTLPVLLSLGMPPAQAIATNKLQASFGSVTAAWSYVRSGVVSFRACLPGAVLTFVGSLLGAAALQWVRPEWLETLVPWLLAAILAGSLVFMLLHGHVASFEDGTLRLNDDPKSLVSAGSAFAVSCWLYLCRFNPLNPGRSLAPSLAGHAVRNLAVFGIKDAQGFVGWN